MTLTVSFENIMACARQSGRAAARGDEKHQRDYWHRAHGLYERFGGPEDALLLIADAYRQGFNGHHDSIAAPRTAR